MNKGNQKIVEMMSVSEEINNINTKVRQLVEDLHGSTGVLINLQELTTKLTKKVGILSNGVNGYKPTKVSIERIRPLRNRDEYRS